MSGARAGYFDGRVSARREVLLSLEGTTLRLRGDGVDACYPLTQVRVSAGVGTLRRSIHLPDNGVCIVEDEEFAATLERLQGKGGAAALLRRWERSLPLALAALALTAIVVVIFMRFGVPALARHVAFALPPEVEASLGKETLATLDRFVFTPSRLPPERRAGLTDLFRRMTGSLPGAKNCRLEFRASELLGANALALPSGIVVVTDGLAELARSDDEISGVLAHELGHVQGRHALRQVLQNSAAGLVMAALTGDILSVTSLSATLPTALVDASFSRDFEREADIAAIAYLHGAGIPQRSYAEILARLQAQHDTRAGTAFRERGKVRNYLSTHPDTGERIRRIMAAQKSDEGR